MAQTDFKAIIVGGSVAGLTLAHTFSSARIDYILLEARDNVAPAAGATILTMPNGARILDQLSVYNSMEDIGEGFSVSIHRKSDGTLISVNEWTKIVEEQLGYKPGIYERQKFLQSLYDQLEDKSGILLNKKVVHVEHSKDSVTVVCADGSHYTGDIVIGADGIHSKIRHEMQRIAEKTNPEVSTRNQRTMTAEYACFFGVSTANPTYNLIPGSITTGYDIDNSSLLFAGRNGQPQWFFVSKLPQKFTSPEIPRFTAADRDAEAAKHADFQLAPGVTLKMLQDTKTQESFLPLEEGESEVWSFGRIVCVGDSVHKMTPNIGQGGNQAIESAAVLTNCLHELLSASPKTSIGIEALGGAFQKYQDIRWKRAKMFIDMSGTFTRNEALAKLSYTIRLLFLEPFTTEFIADLLTGMFKGAPYLHHLPMPNHLEGNNVWKTAKPKQFQARYVKTHLYPFQMDT
ncbi:monooxygenase [Bisporella sp. PMI_857]|nr:monooxygenase [Bisporella sp. PMI_857]